jgi:polysaccharide chain length determinant protein (PEP-CTERM system associated)
MVSNGEVSLADVKRLLRRYGWILPLATIVLGAVGLAAAMVLPKKYTSQTMVAVEQPAVSEKYVPSVVTEDLNQRLTSMQEEILSRTRLQPIVEKFGLYASDRSHVHMDDLVDRLRTAIAIKPVEATPGTQSRQLPGFYVTVTFDNPQLAQQICTEVTSMFLEQNARERSRKASQTTSFLSSQLDEAKAKLDEQDGRLAQFKRQYLGSLPEEEQTNLSILMGMNSQLEANTQALSRAQQDKVLSESLFSQLEGNWKAATQSGQNPETMDQQLALLQDQLVSLQGRYTAEHPDVVKARGQIEEMKRRIAEAPKTAALTNGAAQRAPNEPPQMQQLRAKLRQDELNISDLTKRQGKIQSQIQQLQGRVQASPVVEQQFKEITRSYQSALEFYNSLLKSRDTAAMASDLEHQQQSEQFKVLDPPSLPNSPSFPKKAYFAGGGLGGGLALGLGILYLIAASDKSMYTERDVEVSLRLPVLALVPTLDVIPSTGGSAARVTNKKYESVASQS